MGSQLKTILLLGSLTALAVVAASAFAPSWAFAIAAVAVVFNAAMYFWSDRLVLRLRCARDLARDEAPALHAMNDRLAAAAGIPVPRLYLVDAAMPTRSPRAAGLDTPPLPSRPASWNG
jgi:heat shock protein HtpX